MGDGVFNAYEFVRSSVDMDGGPYLWPASTSVRSLSSLRFSHVVLRRLEPCCGIDPEATEKVS